MATMEINMTVDGTAHKLQVEPWRSLAEVLRDDLGLTQVAAGCAGDDCGQCTVRVDGQAVAACLYLAAEAHLREVSVPADPTQALARQPWPEALARLGVDQWDSLAQAANPARWEG